jgi:hypothetical protein
MSATSTPIADAADYEKLGVFYLGRPYDLTSQSGKLAPLLYDSRDLVTHAVCFGMTGSGKTGLCLGLLEEAAMDGIPAIAIDPKGDIGNLLLGFPDLRPNDFEPWVQEAEAQRAGLTVAEFAARQAELWKNGLAKWGQDGERIRKMQETTDFAIYTPGSDAGIPVSILKSFEAPPEAAREDREYLRDRVNATTTALLGLLGIEADPVQSREHILIANLLHTAWSQGQDLDLASLIGLIQKPPMTRVGVLDLESFYPAKERFGLAMLLNNLLASPSFGAWMHGDALEIDAILRTSDGKPRISVFSIAHLSDAERMFFVSLLLNQVLGWMRQQPGTSSLRAILYMDEIFGFFPPVKNPPSKQPLMTMLKQARAFGLGVVLATQNPVDLDYKGLGNTGTWFIGRLQTDRDRARVLDGLEGSATSAGGQFNRQEMERVLSGLGKRVFLLYNVHDSAPEVFESRWAMSYLAGPLTRAQVKRLMEQRRFQAGAGPASAQQAPRAGAVLGAKAAARPVLGPDVPQYFIRVRRRGQGSLVYQPGCLGSALVRFTDTKLRLDTERERLYWSPIEDAAVPVRWEEASLLEIRNADLEATPLEGAGFGELAAAGSKARNYTDWKRDFTNWLSSNEQLELLQSPSTKEVSAPDETEAAFRARIEQALREQRDTAMDQLRRKYAPKTAALEERIRRAQATLAKEKAQAQEQRMQSYLSVGATILGAFLGRKPASASTVGKVASTARTFGRASREAQDVGRATENLDVLREQLQKLNSEFTAEADQVALKLHPGHEQLTRLPIKPKKTGIQVRLVALGWLPYWRENGGFLRPPWE